MSSTRLFEVMGLLVAALVVLLLVHSSVLSRAARVARGSTLVGLRIAWP